MKRRLDMLSISTGLERTNHRRIHRMQCWSQIRLQTLKKCIRQCDDLAIGFRRKPETMHAVLRQQQHPPARQIRKTTIELDAGLAPCQPQHLEQTMVPVRLNLPIVQATARGDGLAVHQIGRELGRLLPI